MITAAEYGGAVFLSCPAAAKVLGIGQSTLRQWCAAGRVPHIKSGTVNYINMPMLLDLLDTESRKRCKAFSAEDGPRLEPLDNEPEKD